MAGLPHRSDFNDAALRVSPDIPVNSDESNWNIRRTRCHLWNNVCYRKWAAMDYLINALIKLGTLKDDLDYYLLRASMVIVYFFFGYQKWFEYEAQALIPYISNGPLIFWMYPTFGIRGQRTFWACRSG
jgi:Protein of unknown function, DUF417